MTFDEAMAYALTLPGTERSTSYGKPCVKANGNGVLFVGHEPHEAFALRLEPSTKQMLLATHPESFFETPHYAGHPIVLVRYTSPDAGLIRELIAGAVEAARASPPPRPRKRQRA